MMTNLLFKLIVIGEDERGLLYRAGKLEALLGAGRHRLFNLNGAAKVETHKATRAEFPVERYETIARVRPDIAEQAFENVVTGEGEVAIVSMDGLPKLVLAPFMQRVFWKAVTRIDVRRIQTKGVLRVAREDAVLMDMRVSNVATETIVEAHEVGLLFVDGAFVETLKPGRHTFWTVQRTVKIVKLDLRPQPLEVTAQEILTKDRIGLRVTLTAFYRIVDPAKAQASAGDLAGVLYRLVQFAVREAVATRTLDEILAARETLEAELRAYVGARLGELGVVMPELGLKDVILPGDVRALINKVVEAEKIARANVIRRQEETAATRSLLNTAKLMQDNPLLLRLKEMETLEKLAEKVDKISLSAGEKGAFDALLTDLVRLKA
jgi:regulator of protease activity HflC (stomatin/prohibitin superfamily)